MNLSQIIRLYNNRYFAAIILFTFINFTLSGCYSVREISIDNNLSVKIYKIETFDGEIIEFDNTKLGYAFISGNEIVSIKLNEEPEKFPLSEVKKYYTKKFDIPKTVGLVLLIPVVFVVTIVVIIAIRMQGRGFGG